MGNNLTVFQSVVILTEDEFLVSLQNNMLETINCRQPNGIKSVSITYKHFQLEIILG